MLYAAEADEVDSGLAERKRVAHDLLRAQLDVARLSALKTDAAIDALDFVPPAGASEADVAQTKAAMIAQATEQQQKLASIERQVAERIAESEQARQYCQAEGLAPTP